ncbi:MAG: hypothetical protein EZS28_050967, partial [Streblomastix strix]
SRVVVDPNIYNLESLQETLPFENSGQLRQWKRKNISGQLLTGRAYLKQWEREVKDAELMENDVEEDSDCENSEESNDNFVSSQCCISASCRAF